LRVAGVEREPWPHLRRSLDEEPHRGQTAQLGQVGRIAANGQW
jgi:hypothetical protein